VKRAVAFAFLFGGCAAQGVTASSLPGTWELSQSGATAHYTFETNSQFTFDGSSAGAAVHLQGAWFVDGAKLTLSFDGHGTFDVSYTIDGAKLTITDDPATVRAGSHADAIYIRQ
jgi:hypothetical protein